jgi:hypothetical protein
MTSESESERRDAPRVQPDPETIRRAQTEGLVETGAADIPGVQDLGPADADEEAEGAQPFTSRPASSD